MEFYKADKCCQKKYPQVYFPNIQYSNTLFLKHRIIPCKCICVPANQEITLLILCPYRTLYRFLSFRIQSWQSQILQNSLQPSKIVYHIMVSIFPSKGSTFLIQTLGSNVKTLNFFPEFWVLVTFIGWNCIMFHHLIFERCRERG